MISARLLFSCDSKKTKEVVAETVFTKDRNLMVNNLPYSIKGICYHPVPKGSDQRNFNSLEADLQLMHQAGINTIRVYKPIDEIAVLNKIHKAGLKLIVGFGYNQNGKFDILSGTYLNYIERYKNHPAILLWELGNEYNYHPEWFDGDMKNWYSAMNKAADKIHKLDPNHPVTTAHGELPDALALKMGSHIDIWGMNIYRWDNPEKLFSEWEAVSDKPMYLSEAGADSYMTISKGDFAKGVNEEAQATATDNILTSVFKNQNTCAGVTLFAFVDELWKAGNNDQLDPGGWAPNSSGVPYDGTPNEEYWGIVKIDRTPKKAFKIVQKHYQNTPRD